MGQKVNPIGLRLNITRPHNAVWYANKNFDKFLINDQLIRNTILTHNPAAAISNIRIERQAERSVHVNIFTARPGVVIGKQGEDVEKLKQKIAAVSKVPKVLINIIEEKKPEVVASLIAENVKQSIEMRVPFKRLIKKVANTAKREGALGVKVQVSGRLGGAEIARCERCSEGRMPLHTLRARIDYCATTAHTTYGCIGVKVWVFKGEQIGSMTEDNTTNTVSRPAKHSNKSHSRKSRKGK